MKTNAENQPSNAHLYLTWVYSDSLENLDAVTWLIPTQTLREAGWSVTLIAPGDPKQTEIQGIPIEHIARPDIFFLRQVIFHARVIKKLSRQGNEFDILLFHEGSAPWFLLFYFSLKLFRKPAPLFVMDTRSMPMEPEDKATWKDRLRGALAIQMNKFANRFFEGRTAITQRMAKALEIPEKKLWGVWPSGVKLETFSNASQVRDWPKAGEAINILYTGSIHHERNLLTLSKAVTQANAEEHIFTLTILGDGNARAELENYAREQGRHIMLYTPVPYAEIPSWLSNAHIGALPFPDEEKFRVSSPIKLFEYLAAGLPILATRIACHTDVIKTDGVAFWANTADQKGLFEALQQVKENRDKLAKMGKNATTLAKEWTWQSSADKLKRALEQGLRENKVP